MTRKQKIKRNLKALNFENLEISEMRRILVVALWDMVFNGDSIRDSPSPIKNWKDLRTLAKEYP